MQCYAQSRKRIEAWQSPVSGNPKDFPVLNPQFDTHAIDSMSVTCEFTADVNVSGLELVKNQAKRFQTKLPYRRVKRKAGQTTPSHDLSSNASPEVLGYMFYSKSKEEECDSFEIYESFASYTTRAYSNFKSFLADSIFYLGTANTAFNKSGGQLKRIIVRYQNKFASPNIDWEPSESLKVGSRLLPPACLERKGDFWHCALGLFGHEFRGAHILHNIKLNHSVRKVGEDYDISEYFLTIDCVHVTEFTSDHIKPLDSDEFADAYENMLDHLREKNGEMLRDILSDGLSARIGLNSQSRSN